MIHSVFHGYIGTTTFNYLDLVAFSGRYRLLFTLEPVLCTHYVSVMTIVVPLCQIGDTVTFELPKYNTLYYFWIAGYSEKIRDYRGQISERHTHKRGETNLLRGLSYGIKSQWNLIVCLCRSPGHFQLRLSVTELETWGIALIVASVLSVVLIAVVTAVCCHK